MHEPKSFATDDRGFINTAARCEKPKFAVAMGRTQRSLVAICVDGRGHYEYHGLRLSDDSVLNVPARAMADGKFIVVNAGFTYTFSPKELVIAPGRPRDSQGTDGGLRRTAPGDRRIVVRAN